MTREPITDREEVAARLLESSLRTSYDPVVEIDWAAPLDPDAFWMPPQRCSLYGTPLWNVLSHRQRVELTKHEVASGASAGIWFETILMRMLLRDLHDADPTTLHAQYAYTEIADECRHSVMFARMIERMGCPPYPATGVEQWLSRIMPLVARGPQMYAAILLAEEILDSFQREIMADMTLQPLIRAVAHIHVVEEARHVRYARTELARQVQAADRLQLAIARLVIGRTAFSVARRLIHPQVYAAVGIDPREGRAIANANPHFRATLRWSARKAYGYLSELDLVSGPGRAFWQRAGLI